MQRTSKNATPISFEKEQWRSMTNVLVRETFSPSSSSSTSDQEEEWARFQIFSTSELRECISFISIKHNHRIFSRFLTSRESQNSKDPRSFSYP